VFSGIVGDTLRALNVPPDMPVKQLVVSDDPAKVVKDETAAAPKGRAAGFAPARPITVSAATHAHPGVVR
jgi:cell division protein FtsI (penicillin-binding protein 3)